MLLKTEYCINRRVAVTENGFHFKKAAFTKLQYISKVTRKTTAAVLMQRAKFPKPILPNQNTDRLRQPCRFISMQRRTQYFTFLCPFGSEISKQ